MEKGGVSELKAMSKEMTESEEQRIYCFNIFQNILKKYEQRLWDLWVKMRRQWCKKHFLIHGYFSKFNDSHIILQFCLLRLFWNYPYWYLQLNSIHFNCNVVFHHIHMLSILLMNILFFSQIFYYYKWFFTDLLYISPIHIHISLSKLHIINKEYWWFKVYTCFFLRW